MEKFPIMGDTQTKHKAPSFILVFFFILNKNRVFSQKLIVGKNWSPVSPPLEPCSSSPSLEWQLMKDHQQTTVLYLFLRPGERKSSLKTLQAAVQSLTWDPVADERHEWKQQLSLLWSLVRYLLSTMGMKLWFTKDGSCLFQHPVIVFYLKKKNSINTSLLATLLAAVVK